MKGFSARERRIISAVYNDCERIALERVSEAHRYGNWNRWSAGKMSEYLASIFMVRKEQILKRGAHLPRKRMHL